MPRVRVYKCPFCGERFQTKQGRKSHLVRQHNQHVAGSGMLEGKKKHIWGF